MSTTPGARRRSLFWPGLLILVGGLALLANTGLISPDRLYSIVYLWPVVLIVVGLELIVRKALTGLAGEVAAVLIVVVAVAGSVAYVAGAQPLGGTHTLDASGSAGDLTQASAEIDVGAATITVDGSSDLGGDLYRAHIEYSGPSPSVSLDQQSGDLVISQSSSNFVFLQNQRFVLNLKLSSSVSWAIVENSGAAKETFNFGGTPIRSLSLNTGASHEDITLGPASGIVPVNVNGGAVTVNVHRPAGTAASVDVSGGFVSLTADGKQSHSVGSASFQTPDYAGATDGYRIEVNGGACTVTLDKTKSS